MLARPKFQVKVTIGRVSRLPQNSGSVQVRWKVADSPRTDTRGKTASRDIEQHEVVFDEHAEFAYSFGVASPSKTLKSKYILFEVLWGPSRKHKIQLGTVEFDMAQYAGLKPEPHAFLLEGSRINCLLILEISLEHIKGPTDYRVPEFNAPILKRDLAAGMGIDDRPIQPGINPNVKAAFRKQMNRPALLANLQATHSSPFALDPVCTALDLAAGGDGFGGRKGPCEVDMAHYDGNLCDEGIRENLISWHLRF